MHRILSILAAYTIATICSYSAAIAADCDENSKEITVKVTVEGSSECEASGSGVIITRQGHILTAAHVVRHEIENPGQCKIEVQRGVLGKVYEAKLSRKASKHLLAKFDLALLHSGKDFKTRARFCRLRDAGYRSYAIAGHPSGDACTQDEVRVSYRRVEQERKRDTYVPSAFSCGARGIEGGMSGGPVLDKRGRVFGVVKGSRADGGVAELALVDRALYKYLDLDAKLKISGGLSCKEVD